MNGAESLIRTAVDSGVEVCFANPGTTEMHLVAALDAVPGMRAVLGLFEGVITGAADGYGRMAGKPAMCVLHLGPGFANGIANLHNARRAHTPIVNVIGDQATWHLAADAPLTSDIDSLARPVSRWVRSSKTSRDVAADTAAAVAAARAGVGGVATLIVPADCAWGEGAGPAKALVPEEPTAVASARIDAVAEVLRTGARANLLLGGQALRERGLRAAARIAAVCEARLVVETFPARMDRGGGLPAPPKLPYFPEQAVEFLATAPHAIVAGAPDPVAFFGYPNMASSTVPDGVTLHRLADPSEAVTDALEALAEALGAPPHVPGAAAVPELPTGDLNPATLGQAIAALQPENGIVMDEAATSGFPYFAQAGGCAPHAYMGLTGGAIGQGLPCATGAAIACPERTVIAFQADGSGMYTVQSLWTQARESLNVKTVLCNNRAYRILKVELARADITHPGPAATSLTDLDRPEIRWCELATSLGVPAERATTADEAVAALRHALAEPGPYLVEAVL